MPAETTTAICSMIMGGIFEKFPKLKVCFAHGESTCNCVVSCYNKTYNVFLYYQDRVILGTDYPFPLGELEPGKLIDSMDDFDNKLKDKLKAGNALEFLGLSRKQFE
ncbi:hypothetical protein CIB84_000576 [Bambusicola thoracicus]|uniref:2-amino-3-carboxymuconate-6-semialdehyde decarboxylase n=1 Tax=Bambusicola thoracicus TaxID=9083 RepID=A0A2P4TH28_BAMTH|nr:hypothetical protein CIB84_000576 [Bambusicola thoracicus]